MASLFEEYERQYGTITSEITYLFSKLAKSEWNDQNEYQKIREKINNQFHEAKDVLEQMELEIASIPIDQRSKYKNRKSSHSNELANLEAEYNKVKAQRSRQSHHPLHYQQHPQRHHLEDSQNRAELFEVDVSMKKQLLANSDALERAEHKVEDGLKLTLESQQIGSQVLSDLTLQRETLERSRDKLRNTHDTLGKSSRILNAMTKKILQNRVMLALILIFLLLIVSVSAYLIIRKHTS